MRIFAQNMELEERLSGRIGMRDIEEVCRACSGHAGDDMKEHLYNLIFHSNDRIAYNALWIITHFRPEDISRLQYRRNDLIDSLTGTGHTGRRRLLLTLIDRLETSIGDVRTDYLDYCLGHINSTDPCGIRSLCIKQAYAQCRFYPALLMELKAELELMEQGDIPPGLRSAKKNILKKIDI